MSVEETKVIDVGFQPDLVFVTVNDRDHLACVGCLRHDRPMMEFKFAEGPWCSIACLTLAILEDRVHLCSARNDKWALGSNSPTSGMVDLTVFNADGFTIGWSDRQCSCQADKADKTQEYPQHVTYIARRL